jgi:hypothetical protein
MLCCQEGLNTTIDLTDHGADVVEQALQFKYTEDYDRYNSGLSTMVMIQTSQNPTALGDAKSRNDASSAVDGSVHSTDQSCDTEGIPAGTPLRLS